MEHRHTPAPPDMLPWPVEAARTDENEFRWNDGGFNRVFDFHGDPTTAGLTLFSDGNHHMALEQVLRAFVAQYPAVGDVFYVTLPPNVIASMLTSGEIRLGNLRLTLAPQVFISPLDVLEPLSRHGPIHRIQPFARSRGCALMVVRGNPRGVRGMRDLYRDDIRLFLSNPERERASFRTYSETLCALARAAGLDAGALADRLEHSNPACMHGRLVHHREAPAALASGQADVAVLYHHLALRYLRVFPDHFEMVALPGSADVGPFAHHVVTTYGVGLIGDGGPWGPQFHEFLRQDAAAQTYRTHGLDAPLIA